MDDILGGWIGDENLGCSFVLSGTASIPGHMGRLLGGMIDPEWPEWWANETRQAQGGVAHEIGHGLGGSCVNDNNTPGNCDGLPHTEPGEGNIMFEWWDFNSGSVFNNDQKAQILSSPFIY
jgi:hypothetical protein